MSTTTTTAVAAFVRAGDGNGRGGGGMMYVSPRATIYRRIYVRRMPGSKYYPLRNDAFATARPT